MNAEDKTKSLESVLKCCSSMIQAYMENDWLWFEALIKDYSKLQLALKEGK